MRARTALGPAEVELEVERLAADRTVYLIGDKSCPFDPQPVNPAWWVCSGCGALKATLGSVMNEDGTSRSYPSDWDVVRTGEMYGFLLCRECQKNEGLIKEIGWEP